MFIPVIKTAAKWPKTNENADGSQPTVGFKETLPDGQATAQRFTAEYFTTHRVALVLTGSFLPNEDNAKWF